MRANRQEPAPVRLVCEHDHGQREGRVRIRPLHRPENLWQEIGTQIRQLRKAMGYPTAHALAEAVTTRFDLKALPPVAKWESGDPHVTSAGVFQIDTLLGCDGYLIWMAAAASSADADRRGGPPRLPGSPREVLGPWPQPDGTVQTATLAATSAAVVGHLLDGLDDDDAVRLEVEGLVADAADLTYRRVQGWAAAPPDELGVSADDVAAYVDEQGEAPEHPLVAGSLHVHTFRVRNAGSVPWKDRFLLALSHPPDLRQIWPSLWPVPDTGPGDIAEVRLPLRAPAAPGYHYPILRQVLPDGRLTFPTSPRGLDLVVLVPHPDHRAWWPAAVTPAKRWVFVASSRTPVDILVHKEAGRAMERVRTQVITGPVRRASRKAVADVLPPLSGVRPAYRARRMEEIEKGLRGLTPEQWSQARDVLADLPHRLAGRPASEDAFRDALAHLDAVLTSAFRKYQHDSRPDLPPPLDIAARARQQLSGLSASAVGRALGAEFGLLSVLSRLDDPHLAASPVDQRWCMSVVDDPPLPVLGSKEITLKRWVVRNDGRVGWRGLLLGRLGPAVASPLPLTPCAIAVPDAQPGEQVVMDLPIAAPYLAGTVVIHFVPYRTDGRPAWPDDRRTLPVRVVTSGRPGSTTRWWLDRGSPGEQLQQPEDGVRHHGKHLPRQWWGPGRRSQER